jgi:hypothetical protein
VQACTARGKGAFVAETGFIHGFNRTVFGKPLKWHQRSQRVVFFADDCTVLCCNEIGGCARKPRLKPSMHQRVNVRQPLRTCVPENLAVPNRIHKISHRTGPTVLAPMALCLVSTLNFFFFGFHLCASRPRGTLNLPSSNAPRSNVSGNSQQRLSPPTGPSPTFSLVGSS